MEPTEDQTPEDFLACEKLRRLQPPNPELDNFISRVTEISDVIHCLSSPDPTLNERGLRKADILLHQQPPAQSTANFDDNYDETTSVQVTSNRSVINKFVDPDPNTNDGEGSGGDNMKPDAFMRMVEKDAKERAENRRIRKQHSDRFKNEAIVLFRQQKYTEALCKFDKAIEWLKDSPLLYTNRAITYIKLEIYSKAISDCDIALRLSEESCLKAKLYKAKALAAMGDIQASRQLFHDTAVEHPESEKLIRGYETETFDKLP